MRKILRISSVLSWINLIIWGLLCAFVLLGALVLGNLAFLIALVFPSAVVLHSYAALQLHKSVRDPAVPLSSQTPTGIRFIGFVALFVGISNLFSGVTIIQNSREIIQQLQSQIPPEMKNFKFKEVHIHTLGIITLLVGLSVVVNANLNFRLLRQYYLSREKKDNP